MPFNIRADYQAHFYWGAAMGLSALWLGWWAMAPIAIAAFSKEVWDRAHPPHQVEALDAVSTILGGACSAGLVFIRMHWS